MKKLILDQMKNSQERLDRSWAKEKAPWLISRAKLHTNDYAVSLTGIINRQLVFLNEELGFHGWHLARLLKNGFHAVEKQLGKNGLPPGVFLCEQATGARWKILARGEDQDGWLVYSLESRDGQTKGIDQFDIGRQFIVTD